MIDRRILLASAAGLASLFGLRWPGREFAWATGKEVSRKFEIEKTDDEWRTHLTPAAVSTCCASTAPSAPSPAPLKEHRKGTFACAGCDLPLFSSETKFESGTGWPSFWQPLRTRSEPRPTKRFGMTRTEVHCRRCGGHLGHVFDDGPKPTGLRYCMDGVALVFHPASPSAT